MIACEELKIGELKIENYYTGLITINAALQIPWPIKTSAETPCKSHDQ